MSKMPSLEALRIFEVAGRHGSYSKAANELHITHGAVSQRIRQLEGYLGFPLFQREGNRMVLTANGRRLHAAASHAIAELTAAVKQLAASSADVQLTVSLLPVMAARWLIPRLPRFNARYPSVFVNIKTDRALANFASDGVDVALRFGTGSWKGMRAVKLMDEEIFPVCSPTYNQGRIPREPSALLDERLIIDRNLSWTAWFRSAGVAVDRKIVGTSFVDANLLIDAALAGQGVALGRLTATRHDILSGRLIRLSDHRYVLPLSHFVVYPAAGESNPTVMAFRDWLLEEAALSVG